MTAVLAFLKGIPTNVWLGLAAIVLLVGYGEARHSAGKRVVLERLERAQIEAEAKAESARRVADEEAQHRAEEFEEQAAVLEEVIEDAKATDSNPIDALIGSLSETD